MPARGPERKTTPCGGGSGRGCGKPAEMREEDPATGVITTKKIPLDPSAPVYRIVEDGETPIIIRDKDAMVLHHKTCPKASDFSKSKDKP